MNVTHMLKELSAHFIRFTECGLAYGPQGRLFLKNLEEHWFLHCITMSQYNIFLSDKSYSDLNFITNTPMGTIPFGVAVVETSRNEWNQNIISTTSKLNSHKTAKVSIFNIDVETKDLYQKIQKDRKLWWRKLAQNPSRFKTTEAKKLKDFNLVDIEAHFSFGTILVERIAYHTDVQKLFSQVACFFLINSIYATLIIIEIIYLERFIFQIDNKKEFTNIQMVEHTVSLDWGCLALLCDAYNTDKSTKMHIHSKLAPHKVALYIKRCDVTNTQNDDFDRFVLYLNNMLRAKGLNTIITSSEQIIDTCIVPFVVSVDRTSLENGIIHVTNRLTTLNEAIHITDLVKYVIMHC